MGKHAELLDSGSWAVYFDTQPPAVDFELPKTGILGETQVEKTRLLTIASFGDIGTTLFLDQETVRELLPHLERFVKTGRLV